MITASHNPAMDNGYKLYWKNGAQINHPIDGHISEHILNNLEPWNFTIDYSFIQQFNVSDICNSYLNQLKETFPFNYIYKERINSNLSITYTAMHGVGFAAMKSAYDFFGISNFVTVEEQVSLFSKLN